MDYSYQNNKIEIKDINKDKKYLDVLYYKICNEEKNKTELYYKNKEFCEKYKNIIYPEIMILYMDIINYIKFNKIYYHLNFELKDKINLLKNYVNIYSYQNSSL